MRCPPLRRFCLTISGYYCSNRLELTHAMNHISNSLRNEANSAGFFNFFKFKPLIGQRHFDNKDWLKITFSQGQKKAQYIYTPKQISIMELAFYEQNEENLCWKNNLKFSDKSFLFQNNQQPADFAGHQNK